MSWKQRTVILLLALIIVLLATVSFSIRYVVWITEERAAQAAKDICVALERLGREDECAEWLERLNRKYRVR